jgi:hypothetical protein
VGIGDFIGKAPPPAILAFIGEPMQPDELQPIALVPFTDGTVLFL